MKDYPQVHTDQLLGELKEFKRMATAEFFLIRKEIESLNRFRWSLYAGSGVISSLVALIINLIQKG